MGPFIFLFAWLIIGIIVLSVYVALHFLGKRWPVTSRIQQSLRVFYLVILAPIAILAIMNILKIIFFE